MKYIEGVGEMPNSQTGEVEALRRELADLIVQWAGKAVENDPDGPLGAALTRAVSQAAREAVSEQHQALSRRDAEDIAEAFVRLRADQPASSGLLALPQKTLLAVCAAVVAVAALTFIIGLQLGRTAVTSEAAVDPALSVAAATPFAPSTAPPGAAIAPQAPAAEPTRVVARAPENRASPTGPPPRRATPSEATGRPAPAAPADTGGQPVTGARAPAQAPATEPAPAPAP